MQVTHGLEMLGRAEAMSNINEWTKLMHYFLTAPVPVIKRLRNARKNLAADNIPKHPFPNMNSYFMEIARLFSKLCK